MQFHTRPSPFLHHHRKKRRTLSLRYLQFIAIRTIPVYRTVLSVPYRTMKRSTAIEEEQQYQQQQQQPEPDYNSGDSLISKALLNLSFHDRNAIEEEIHGVSSVAAEETPELLEDSLYNFKLELDKIYHKPAHDKAQEMLAANSSTHSSCYINEEEFRLRFLRCELFDVSKAAARFVKYLDLILEVYGEYALRRPIRLTDLNREEMSFLREGQYQLLPYRDRSGRRILAIVPNNRDDVPQRVLLKVFIYIWIVASGGCDTSTHDLNNVESQRKGTIVVIFPSSTLHVYSDGDVAEPSQKKFLRDRVTANAIVAKVTPMRLAAIHVCLPNKPVYHIVSHLYGMVLAKWNSRTKIHLGNPLELRYCLQGYGIPIELIPSTDTGNVKSVNFKQWIKLRVHLDRQMQERMTAIASSSDSDGGGGNSGCESTDSTATTTPMYNIVECPGSNDVIFRRGKSMTYHPGNVIFQNLIESKMQEHTIDPNTSQQRRIAIEMELMQEVRDAGGRFLKWEIDKSWWTNMDIYIQDSNSTNYDSSTSTNTARNQEAADKEIRSKVHYAFRDFKKKMMKIQQNVQVNNSSTYAFEHQDGQKRKRINNNNTNNNNGSGGGGLGGCMPFCLTRM